MSKTSSFALQFFGATCAAFGCAALMAIYGTPGGMVEVLGVLIAELVLFIAIPLGVVSIPVVAFAEAVKGTNRPEAVSSPLRPWLDFLVPAVVWLVMAAVLLFVIAFVHAFSRS